MEYYNKIERLNIVLDITKKLKNYPGKNGGTVDLYKDDISFIEDYKKITNEYISQKVDEYNELKEYSGSFEFIELGKRIDYIFPVKKNKKPLFVIRFSE